MLKQACLLCIILWSIPLCAFAQQADVRFSASDVKADLQYLYSSLQQSHYNLWAFVPKSRYDQAFKRAQKSIGQDSVSLLETVKLFQRFTALGNVGHSEIDFPVQSYIAFASGGGALFPLELAFEEGKAYIRKNFSANPALAAGVQVVRINGMPVNEIRAGIHPYLSAERPYFKDAKLEFWSFPRMYWMVYGEKEKFTIDVKSPAGENTSQTAAAISVMEFETKRAGEILNSERILNYYNKAAYLNPGPFSSSDPLRGEAKFKSFVDSAFADIRTKNSETLILDLRNNSGGHNAYSDYLISYFADKPFGWYSSFKLKTSALLKEQTRKQGPETEMDDYSKAILAHGDGEIFDYKLPLQQEVAADKRFTGRVYVLINRQTYSMAAVSAALIQDYGFATLVGEETGDVPTLYASQFSFPLPKTGIVVKVPKGYMVRPNGDERLSGVVPELKIRDHLLDDKDEILEFILQHIQKQGGKQ